jgi:TetR/AcrR family transcriptional regulator, regulator of autoinduction and epiphytic fitness
MPAAEPSSARADAGEVRSPRAERSRAAIADAALELLRAGHLRPTAGQVAAQAGISERLIYHHFSDLEELFAMVAARQVAAVQDRTPPVITTGPLELRLRAILDARAEMNEWITPVRRASVVREPFSEALAASRAMLNAGSRQQVAEVFATEIAAVADVPERGAAEADDLLAGLDLALSWPAWNALRVRGSSVEQARRVVERTVRALLSA